MEKHIQNLPQLEQPNGKPYVIKAEDSEYAPTLGQSVAWFLERLPLATGQLGTMDFGRAYEVARICSKAKDVIVLDSDQYTWLLDILFSDEWGPKVHRDSKGAWAPNAFGLWAIAVRKGLMQLQIGADDKANGHKAAKDITLGIA